MFLAVLTKNVHITNLRLPSPILALIHQKRRLRRLFLRDWDFEHLRHEYKRLTNNVKDAIRNHKLTKLNALCDRAETDFSHHFTSSGKQSKE